MPDLTVDEIDEIRTTYIRDKYSASPLVALSHYNRAVKANFFADADLEKIHDRLQTDFAEELQGVYDAKYYQRLGAGDLDADAVTAATAEKKQALFRLIRAECFESMMMDPGFVGSVADKDHRASLFAVWEKQIARDRTFTKSRGSALLSVPIVRL